MMVNYINYNNQALPSPTPMVTISKEIKTDRKKIGDIEKIELNGQITGNNFIDLQLAQKNLIDIFSQNFKTFKILEKNNLNNFDEIYSRNYVTVKSIDFKESSYNKIIDYSITLESQNFLYNVNNPVNEFNFNQDLEKTNLKHKVSAEGINTSSSSSNALNNAIEFVKNYSGLSTMPSTLFITGEKYSLTSFQEFIDRINGKYEIQEFYTLANHFGGILNYNIDISSGIKNNFINVSLQGTYACGLNESIDSLEDNVNFYNIATGLFSGYLNPTLLDFSLTKNKEKNTISFNCLYDNDNRPNPYIEYKVTKSKNYMYNITETLVEGEIIYRGHQKSKIDQALAIAALPEFTQFGFLKSSNISKTSAGKFSFSKTYSDQNLPNGFTEGNYTISLKPSMAIRKYTPSAVMPIYYIQNFGGNTLEKFQLQGSFKGTGIKNTYGLDYVDPGDLITDFSSYDPVEKIWQYNLEGYTSRKTLTPVNQNTEAGDFQLANNEPIFLNWNRF